MWKYQRTDELYHHGVLGMRWGVRRQQRLANRANRILQKKGGKQISAMNAIRRRAAIRKAGLNTAAAVGSTGLALAGLTAAFTGGTSVGAYLLGSAAVSGLARAGNRYINNNRDYMTAQVASKNPKTLNKGKSKVNKIVKKKKK